jgi:hypothetical protein
MVVVWITIVIACVWGAAMAEWLTGPRSTRALVRQIHQRTGLDEPRIITFGHKDYALSFYAGRPVPPIEGRPAIRAELRKHGKNLVIVADRARWESLAEWQPEFARQFEVAFAAPGHVIGIDRLVLRKRGAGS